MPARGADVATTNLFLRIWAFAIANCAFERSIRAGRPHVVHKAHGDVRLALSFRLSLRGRFWA